MLDWQKKIIVDNKKELLKLFDVNVAVLAALEGKGLISQDESEKLKNPFLDKSTHRDLLLDWITKKDKTDDEEQTPVYDFFIQVLREETQSGAANLLQKKKDEYLAKQVAQQAPNIPTTEPHNLEQAKLKNDVVDGVEVERLRKEYLAEVKECRRLDVNVVKPDQDMSTSFKEKSHVLSKDDVNLCLIINIKNFPEYEDANGDVHNPTRYGSEHDELYMRTLFKQLGFKIFREDEYEDKTTWTKQEVLEAVEAFRKHCNNKNPKSAVIFVGSHGENGYVDTSDPYDLDEKDRKINLWKEVFSQFYNDKCPGLLGKPKVFLVNACQVFPGIYRDDIRITGAAVTDMICCTAQVPGHYAYRDETSGSWFVHCIAFYLMKCAKSMDLMTILGLAKDALSCREGIMECDEHGTEPGQVATVWPLKLDKHIYFHIKPAK